MKELVAQSCLTLCKPMDCSPPGSSVHGILQASILEWVAMSFSRGSSKPRDRTWILLHYHLSHQGSPKNIDVTINGEQKEMKILTYFLIYMTYKNVYVCVYNIVCVCVWKEKRKTKYMFIGYTQTFDYDSFIANTAQKCVNSQPWRFENYRNLQIKNNFSLIQECV